MFQYTKISLNILVDDCKRYAKIFKYASLITTLGLSIYQIVTGFLNSYHLVYLHVITAILVIAFIIIDIIFDHYNKLNAKLLTKRIYLIAITIVKTLILAFAIYEIATMKKVDGIKIILTTLMIIMWVVSIVSRIMFEVIKVRANELYIAIKADVEDIKRPVTKVTNVFKKLTGQKIEVKPIDPKKEKILDKLRRHIKEKDSEESNSNNN